VQSEGRGGKSRGGPTSETCRQRSREASALKKEGKLRQICGRATRRAGGREAREVSQPQLRSGEAPTRPSMIDGEDSRNQLLRKGPVEVTAQRTPEENFLLRNEE